MYEYIKGTIAELSPARVVIEAAGVGYDIAISLQTYSEIEHLTEAKIYVHYVVREDAQLLYGFASKFERELFRHLLSVSGVGGNTARMILSTYSPDELRNIIATGNATLLKNVKGLGLKTAQKIIVELSGKVISITPYEERQLLDKVQGGNEVYEEALAALAMLGFTRTASDKVLKSVLKQNPNCSVEDAIRFSLKQL
ncbi:MAG: Holliday junction branch migration protein RuvA [Rikenellaceae bacterium]|nr:Holliday junction branch migration protein RuvA [Rikenellaceae bacterium]MBP3612832.1 Holliday junction branch migration protein RuvA [Rikenellaceae bacterium]MBP3682768.1 Holliday junction branch migration protein RuvA [Rikenellaceae bacterium]MBQ3254773.1 Holliday junction branch migration protein RuvA [Rikenellaceae bacterium]MBQ6691575.1 Holliday junction branch migration protein RuvA [Rikenellaceae bacterium]